MGEVLREATDLQQKGRLDEAVYRSRRLPDGNPSNVDALNRSIEAVYAEMWEVQLKGELPQSFSVRSLDEDP